jgi:hypothetical protein
MESVNGRPTLLDLFPLAIDLISENLDLLGKIVSIHESYFLLAGPQILQVILRRHSIAAAAADSSTTADVRSPTI